MVKHLITSFLQDESGATAIEYGLLAALLASGLVSSLSATGNGISNLFGGTNSAIQNSI